MEMHARRGNLVGPVVLIGAGIVFLLNNMGVLSWNVWEILLRLWPVLLIAIGLDILIGRRSAVGSLVIVVLLLGVLAGAIWLAMPGMTLAATASGPAFTAEQISQPLEGATKANVRIAPGVGELRVAAGSESAGLVEGTVALGRNERLSRDFSKSGDTAHLALSTSGSTAWWPFSFGEPRWQNKVWDLKLNRDVSMDLKLETGVGKTDADLSRLTLTNLQVDAGVGQTLVTLPRQGRLTASVQAGVGEVQVKIPAGMAARIQTNGGLGKTDVQGNYRQQNNDYVSPNYENAENRVDLKIDGGVGRVLVQEQAGE